MRHLTVLTAVIFVVWPPQTHAQQASTPRTLDYLTASVAYDVRTTWSNPALLTVVPEASIMGEVRVDDNEAVGLRVGQWSAGFNSRGLSILYQRDRFTTGASGTALRFSLATPFTGGALGASYTIYGQDGDNQTDLDLGLALTLGPALSVGLVARNLRTPEVRGSELPLTLVGSFSASVRQAGLLVSGEASWHKATATADSETRLGGLLTWSPQSVPVAAILAARTDSGFDAIRLTAGVVVGFREMLLLLPTWSDATGSGRIESVSATGLASHRLSF